MTTKRSGKPSWTTPAKGEPPFTKAELLQGEANLAVESLHGLIDKPPTPHWMAQVDRLTKTVVNSIAAMQAELRTS